MILAPPNGLPPLAERRRARCSRMLLACFQLRCSAMFRRPSRLFFSRARRRKICSSTTRANSRQLARDAWAFLAVRKPGEPKVRFDFRRVRRRPAQIDLGDRDRQRRHAVPGRLGDGRADRARHRRPAGRASDLCGRARRRRQAHGAAAEARADSQGRLAAKASSTSTSSASTTRRSATRSRTRWSRCWPTCASACATGSRCWRASTR